MEFLSEPVISRGVCERRFELRLEDVVPGILWTPEGATGPRRLVLIGHGGSQHKRSPNVLAIGRRIVRHLGYAAAAIDAPLHGDRAPAGVQLTREESRLRMSKEHLRQARREWSALIAELDALDEIGPGPVGYWGLSMGTIIGLPFLAGEPRISCAVLGLMGVEPGHKPRSATSLEIPVLFLTQLHDELVRPENALALFDAVGTKDKTMHVNAGLHAAVPAHEVQASEDFFVKHLGERAG